MRPSDSPSITTSRAGAMTENDIPKWLRAQLMAAFRNSTSDPGWYPVHHEGANARLCKLFGLTTDYQEYRIGNAFRLRFDWSIQRWRVSV